MEGSFGGRIGPFVDPATGQRVAGTVHGTFDVESASGMDPSVMMPQMAAALVRAHGLVIQQKLASDRVALSTLQMSLPYYQAEIAQMAGIEAMGFRLLQLRATVDLSQPAFEVPPPAVAVAQTAPPAQPQFQPIPPMAPAPGGWEARVDVGGLQVSASTDQGLDTSGLQGQVVSKAKSQVLWWLVGCGVALLVGLIVSGVIAFSVVRAM